MPGSRVKVVDSTNCCRGMQTAWDLVSEISPELFEIDQICQLQKCSPPREEQSISRVFHSCKPGSRGIVDEITLICRGMESSWNFVPEISPENIRDRSNMSIANVFPSL